MNLRFLFIFPLLSYFLSGEARSASLSGFRCEPANEISRLYKAATEVLVAHEELLRRGDRVISNFVYRSKNLQVPWPLWGNWYYVQTIPGETYGSKYYLSDHLKFMQQIVLQELKALDIEYSYFESWTILIDRLLGRGNFQGKALVKASDYTESCTNSAIP